MTTCKLSEVISPAFAESHHAIKAGSANEIIETGGRGSCKSSFVSLEIPQILLQHPQCHAVVLRKVGATLRNSVYAQIQWSIGTLGLTAYFKCTVSPMEMTYLPTGQKILFFGLDDPSKLKSIKLPFGYVGILWLEEMDQFSGEEELRNVQQSVLRGGPYALIFGSFNPPAMARNWANRYVREAKPGKYVHHSSYLTTPPKWLGQKFLADAEYLKETKPVAYRHEYLGEVVGNGTQVFDNLRLEQLADETLARFDRTVSGVDWGWYPDPWAFNRVSYDAARRTLYIIDELTRLKTDNRTTAQLVQVRIPAEEQVWADAAEMKSVDDYRSFGLRCRAAEKGPGSVAMSMKWLQGLAAIVIDPIRCPATAKEFAEYEYEVDKAGEVLPGYPDLHNHHIDAVRYAMHRTWQRRGA